eukprot:TRINITY_DN2585_c0_g1_i2.p1 TRINITY_DN2585_c0_g1~~TRINITY_DN2585_c0_g1_i2.p1  ORF type:complete len:353 (+),score=77.34 TRINITY_DN2585_c0_g1_i2:95-1060(+)
MKDAKIFFKVKTSVISTLIVEHHFSTARRIASSFCALRYSQIVSRIEFDLNVRLASIEERGFRIPSDKEEDNRVSRIYGGNTSSLPLLPLKKKTSIPMKKRNNQQEIKDAQAKCDNLKLWKQQSKARNHLIPVRQKGLVYICFECSPQTEKSKILQSAKSMKSHYKNIHNFSEEKATKRIMEYEEKEVLLELERRRRSYQAIPKTGINPFQLNEEMKTKMKQCEESPSITKPTTIVIIDTETTSLFNYPNGVFCSVSVRHQLDTKIITTLANPIHNISDVISPGKGREKMWSADSILIHGIQPEQVKYAPCNNNCTQLPIR